MPPSRLAAVLAALVATTAMAACGSGNGTGASATTTTMAQATTRPTVTTTDPTTTTTTLPEPRIADGVLSLTSTAPPFEYELHYPVIENLPATVADPVNQRMAQWAAGAVDEFVGAVDTGSSPDVGGSSGLDGDYEVTFVDREVLSVLIEVSQYFAGAAHPFGTIQAFTFDLATGEELEVADLFLDGSPYLARLAELCRADLAAQLGEGVLFDDGLTAASESFVGWHLAPADLLITFAQYQVAPGAVGQPEVAIPFATLAELIDPDGPIGGKG